jgi:hypothetical protein
MEEKFSLSQALGLTEEETSNKIKASQKARKESAELLNAEVKRTLLLMSPEKRRLIAESFERDLLDPPEFPINGESY